jgi:glycosyltransferase involved in cell wall biosynthesis
MPPRMEPQVTVAVPVKDRRDRMLRCVDALLAQDHPSFEILVLDNCSTDGTPEACIERAKGSKVPLRVEVLPGSVGHIRNRAGDLAHGEILAFTDSDCLPSPGWLSAGVRPFEDPEVGLVQGTTLPEEHPPKMGWPATIQVTEWSGRFESCNILVRRDAFAASDGFDERIGHFWEDTAAGFALLRGGWKTAFEPEALVFHDVTYPGYVWHLKRAQKMQNLAPIVEAYPEIRRELLYYRVFLRERNARFFFFVLGLVLGMFWRPALLLAVPYVELRLDPYVNGHEREWKPLPQNLLYDGAILAGLLRGGIRNGRIVL